MSKCVPQKYQTPRIHRDKQQNLKRSLLLDSLGLNWNDDKETKNRERERGETVVTHTAQVNICFSSQQSDTAQCRAGVPRASLHFDSALPRAPCPSPGRLSCALPTLSLQIGAQRHSHRETQTHRASTRDTPCNCTLTIGRQGGS